jgi:serine/threonine-protein kinase
MQALAAAGDRAGALQLASAHAALLRSELGAQPDPQIEKLAKELREAPRELPVERKKAREEVSAPAQVARTSEIIESPPRPLSRWRSGRLLVPLSVIVLALIVVAAIVTSDGDGGPNTDRIVRSVAVLPFVDNSPQQNQEHFASGIAESILNALANVPGLSVPARSSSFQFRGDSLDLRDVAQRLDVDAVLEGSVQIVGDRLRINVRLAHAGSGYQLFSKQYDGTSADIFAVQDQIAEAIVDELRLQLNNGDQRLFRTETADLAAYELYLRGLQTANTRTREGMQNAVRYFEEAIHIDSTFAAAHAGLADAYVALSDHGLLARDVALTRANTAVARALKLDSASAEAYIAQGHIWNEPGRWDQAEQMFRRAIQLRPSYAAAHMWLANNLMVRGRTTEGLQEFVRASELDPLSPSIITGLSQALSVSGDQEGAISAARRAIDLNPRYPWSHQTLAVALAAQQRFDDALAEATEAVELSEQHPNTLAVLAAVHALAGQPQKAREILSRLQASRPAPAVPAAEALVHASLGDVNTAFALLNRLEDLNAATREWIRVNPVWQPLRADPRWPQLLRNLGLEG